MKQHWNHPLGWGRDVEQILLNKNLKKELRNSCQCSQLRHRNELIRSFSFDDFSPFQTLGFLPFSFLRGYHHLCGDPKSSRMPIPNPKPHRLPWRFQVGNVLILQTAQPQEFGESAKLWGDLSLSKRKWQVCLSKSKVNYKWMMYLIYFISIKRLWI